ncbi:DUF7677 family protein [Jatrophihabitans sp. YIM 134969]
MARLPSSVRAAVRDFAYALGSGTLDGNGLLRGIDYRPDFAKNANELQLVFAVFTNVLRVDDDGRVLNVAEASHRAAALVRRFHQPSFVVDPPFADWEISLG